MQKYENKQDLVNMIRKTSSLFINEFNEIGEVDKDKLIVGVDRSPSQMISYQLGWMDYLHKM